jgi:hypothetical protein
MDRDRIERREIIITGSLKGIDLQQDEHRRVRETQFKLPRGGRKLGRS